MDDSTPFEAVVRKIKEAHSGLDSDGQKVLVELLKQAERGAQGTDGSVAMRFAPNLSVEVSMGSESW